MNIYPNFYKDFSCIAGDCNATCCADWKIGIEKETYNKYQKISGEFGEFVRENIDPDHFFNMTEDNKCPFLNESGLCRIYIECGEDFLSTTCTRFPRRWATIDRFDFFGLSLSCEEVLHLLHHLDTKCELSIEGKVEHGKRESSFLLLLEWGMTLLQNEDIPFGIALSALCYLGSMAFDFWKENNYEGVYTTLAQLPSVLQEFSQAKEDLSEEELRQLALDHIFHVTDTFNQIIFKSALPKCDHYLCEAAYFQMSDKQRMYYISQRVEQQRELLKENTLSRRLAAAFFLARLIIYTESSEHIFTASFANYILLSHIMPLTWSQDSRCDERKYLATAARMNRLFDKSHAIQKFVWPVIKDLFEPDILTYAITFMYIFR